MNLSFSAWRLILSYIVIASIWVFSSDGLLQALNLSPDQIGQAQLLKGVLFVLVTALLLFLVIRKHQCQYHTALQTIKRSEERLLQALDAAHDAMWDWDIRTNKVYCSPRLGVMLGLSEIPPETTPDFWMDRLHPDDKATFERDLSERLKTRNTAPYEYSYRMRHTNGNYQVILFRGRLTLSSEDQLAHLIGTSTDITQRRQDQEALRMAAAVYDVTQEGVLFTNADKLIVRCNPAFIRITGYGLEEILGKSPSVLKSGRHDRAFYENIWNSVATHGTWSGEIWNRRKSGEIYPQWQSIRVIRDLQGAITHYVAVFSDISALKRSQRELDYLAHHDPLSDLPNRLLFSERVELALLRAINEQIGGAVLLLDLDHFKHVNESLGHNRGDLLLKAVAERLKQNLGERMHLARLGGDEFGILYENCKNAEQAAVMAKHLLNCLNQPFEVDDQQLFITASIGISLFPEDAIDAGECMRNADSALFKAKNTGRENYAFYTQELTELASQRVELASALRFALDNNELRVFYQPLFCLGTQQMIGVEALVRWQHPVRGLVPPGEFIPVAEEIGLIAAIDDWVLAQSCQQMVAWQEAGYALNFVAVNVSSRQFARGDLVERVEDLIRQTGINPANLELEVTEGSIMVNPDAALAQLIALRGLGLRLSIDDFGTGYSSLARLKRLPVHKLKLDQSFVAGLPDDHDDIAITRAVIALGHSMGLDVLAEGVETTEQVELLTQLGCDHAQGYYFARPQPAEALSSPGARITDSP